MELKHFRSNPHSYAPPRVEDNVKVVDWSQHREVYRALLKEITGIDYLSGAGLPLIFDNVEIIKAVASVTDNIVMKLYNSKEVVLSLPPGVTIQAGNIGRLGLTHGGWYFVPYPDPTLRRAHELDQLNSSPAQPGQRPNTIGWRCAAKPEGFCAPDDFMPGPGGEFVPDNTVAVEVRVPPEFVTQCEEVGLTPAQVLRGFIADLAGVSNWMRRPRVDGISSNGSDERDMADAYFDRAYGHMREEAEKQRTCEEQAQEDRERMEDESSERSDALEEAFIEFEAAGLGGHAEFLKALAEARTNVFGHDAPKPAP